MIERDYFLAFANFPGVGPIKFNKLIKTFGSAKSAWNSPLSELEPVLKSALTKKFEIFKKDFDFEIKIPLNEGIVSYIRYIQNNK